MPFDCQFHLISISCEQKFYSGLRATVHLLEEEPFASVEITLRCIVCMILLSRDHISIVNPITHIDEQLIPSSSDTLGLSQIAQNVIFKYCCYCQQRLTRLWINNFCRKKYQSNVENCCYNKPTILMQLNFLGNYNLTFIVAMEDSTMRYFQIAVLVAIKI